MNTASQKASTQLRIERKELHARLLGCKKQARFQYRKLAEQHIEGNDPEILASASKVIARIEDALQELTRSLSY